MPSPINDGGPAFPGKPSASEYGFKGMTLRDWFAGQALAGLTGNGPGFGNFNDYASDAYGYADAMLAEREAKK